MENEERTSYQKMQVLPASGRKEKVIDREDVAINTYFNVIEAGPYGNLSMQLYATTLGSVGFKVYATLNNKATVPETGGSINADEWVEITTDIFGGAITGPSISEIATLNDVKYDKFLLECNIGNATNTVKVFTKMF